MKRRFVGLVLLSFACALSSCLHEDPFIVENDAGAFNEGGFTDTPVEDDAYLYPECRACIAAPNDPGPGCATELATMMNAELGKELYNCAYLNGCINRPTHGESLVCAFPCADALGLKGAYNPAILAAIDVSKCLHDFCGPQCEKGGEAGAP